MKAILIGSSAIKHWFPDFPREPKDIDYATSTESNSYQQGVEHLYNPILHKHFSENILNPSALLTLKMSHLFWEHGFQKHLWDVNFLLSKGFKYDEDLLTELRVFFEEYLPKVRRSKLEMTKFEKFKEDFERALRTEYTSATENFIEFAYQPDFGGAELVLDQDSEYHDSYGVEITEVRRTYYFADYDIHVQFVGEDSSYDIDHIYNYFEVYPESETKIVYKPV